MHMYHIYHTIHAHTTCINTYIYCTTCTHACIPYHLSYTYMYFTQYTYMYYAHVYTVRSTHACIIHILLHVLYTVHMHVTYMCMYKVPGDVPQALGLSPKVSPHTHMLYRSTYFKSVGMEPITILCFPFRS